MFFEPLEIPEALLEAQEKGGLVIFAGAGVSMGEPSNLPNFKGLATQIAGSHELAAGIDKHHARLDRFLGELSRDGVDVQGRCRSFIRNPASKPTELHYSLVRLFIKPEHVRIVTTNFDNHFRGALEVLGRQPDCYHAPALPLGHQFSGLVHLHGWAERPDPLVLTDEDFGRAYLAEGWARDFLQRLFSEFTTLFIGYSHDDILVEYLARGMSGRSMAPRFALTAVGEVGPWSSLGVQEITFELTAAPDRFAGLRAGVKRWVESTRRQPTEMAEHVKGIVCGSENLTPTTSSLLKRCLAREDSWHFFTRVAKGWRWVEWLREQGLVTPFFVRSPRDLTQPQIGLAGWLAAALLAEQSDNGLLLVKRHDCIIGERLWYAIFQQLWRNDGVRWTSPLIHKWVLVLTEACPSNRMSDLSHLLRIVAKEALQTLGMVLLRRLTQLRIGPVERFDITSCVGGGSRVEFDAKADFEIVIHGDAPELRRAWEDCFKSRLSDLREPLLQLLEDRLREAHHLYRSAGCADETYDPDCQRTRIDDREIYPSVLGQPFILDLFLDVLEETAERGLSLPEPRLIGWLDSGVPVLVRLGLYALHLSTEIPKPRKVELILRRNFVYPTILIAVHEAWLILSECYSALDLTSRQALWSAVNQGPVAMRPSQATQERWQQWRQGRIDSLTWALATKNKDCSEAAKALEALQRREPSFRGYEGEDQALFGGGTVTEGLRTPKSATDLLSASPGSQIQWLLDYQGGKTAFGETREGLLHAVGAACAQNHAWGVGLLEELGAREAWTSDLWASACWRMNLLDLPQDKLMWLLKSLEAYFAESPSLQGMTGFLFHHVDSSDEELPSAENIDLMIRVSLLIWKQIKGMEPGVTKGHKGESWMTRSINHPAGKIAEFWLKCCDLYRSKSVAPVPGLPDRFKEPFREMVVGADLASQLGRVALARHLPLIYELDPAWAEEQLFPKFRFSLVGEEAFLMWEPHAGGGQLSPKLIGVMPPIYREAFPHFREVETHLQAGFSGHVAVMVCSCLFDVNADNWLREFLTGLSDDQKATWANKVRRAVLQRSGPQRAEIWECWMKRYWDERLYGIPCLLLPKEAENMLEWAFVVGAAFPEAVGLIVRGPRIQESLGRVVHTLETHESAEQFPEAVLRLLDWLLDPPGSRCAVSKDIELVLFRLPKKKSFLPTLNSICEHLASLGYPGATDLKRRVQQAFTAE